jgi:glutamyl-tRNA synthetase
VSVRVRFAPSPTGPLHIGGVRTALYNYLFAKKMEGTFILRIEDTDQTRYVPGAEEYIIESLKWLGIEPTEGPTYGGAFGPYRQSERKDLYYSYAIRLIEQGHAYYAFDTPEELDAAREMEKDDSFKYGVNSRMGLKNSLTLSKEQYQHFLDSGDYVIRMCVPADTEIKINDEVRGEVTFKSNELDDKVILKPDGMPTYHLANIIDDHLMEITHVIRGEEWLPSTAHHVLLYNFFGWTAPSFSHLPLILKPTGKGKLSKRDGAMFGFPVFPLTWKDEVETFPGFREDGMLPDALLNFLALLGWSPGNDQELLSMEEMINLFSLQKIVKSGARFDYEKAKWFNQQYILAMPDEEIAAKIQSQAIAKGYNIDNLSYCASMMKARVGNLHQILEDGYFLFEKPHTFDDETFKKKYKEENKIHFEAIAKILSDNFNLEIDATESQIKSYITSVGAKMGEIFPILRISLTGTMQGPDLFDTISFLGGKEAASRILLKINNI